MNVSEYPHPERLVIPNKLVLGDPKDYEVLEVFSTPTTTPEGYPRILFHLDDRHNGLQQKVRGLAERLFVKPEAIEVALIMPKHFEGNQGFEMKLAQVHKHGLTTLAAEVIGLESREQFQLWGKGWVTVWFDTENPNLQNAEYRAMGHAGKIDALENEIQKRKHILTARPQYVPAWQQAARELAPFVAAFFVQTQEQPAS